MKVKVVYFGILRELAGGAEERLDVAEAETLGDLFAQLLQAHPELERFAKSVALAVNLEYAERTRVLRDGDEVAVIPPVSGGAADLKSAHCEIVRERIHVEELAQALRAGEDGAVIVFEGVVRNNTRGRRTLYLDYESYESMALQKLNEIAAEIHTRFAVDRIAIAHRLGRLEIGETSVFIAISAPHRAASAVCRVIG